MAVTLNAPSSTSSTSIKNRFRLSTSVMSQAVLLLGTAVLYLWNLSSSGYANSFYAAAIQAGTKNWVAWLFGSLDAGNAITVDKPPAAFWLPGLLGRIFGFSPLSMLLPQALMGVASVWLLCAAVKRTSGLAAGLFAGAALALTPVAALMFRFNNPDAMLTLCLVAAAYAMVRALEKPGWKWVALAGAILGLAFLTKMLQGFISLPALALVYLWASNTTIWRRIRDLAVGFGALVVVAGAYIVAFQLTPTSIRPYMGGSTTNSFLELAFGYNGLGRLFGGHGNTTHTMGADATGGDFTGGDFPGGGFSGGNFPGNQGWPSNGPGPLRLFSTSFGIESSWLLVAALIALVAGLWLTRKASRIDSTRSALILWGGWLVVGALTISFMKGTTHPYYTVSFVPAIAALVAIGGRELYVRRQSRWASITLAAMLVVTGLTSAYLLHTGKSFYIVLGWIVLGVSLVAAIAVLVPRTSFKLGEHRWYSRSLLGLCIVAMLAGPALWTLNVVSKGHQGSAASSSNQTMHWTDFPEHGMTESQHGSTESQHGSTESQHGMDEQHTGMSANQSHDQHDGSTDPTAPEGMAASAPLRSLLEASKSKWSAIVSRSTNAADLELATGTSVIAQGGFGGNDPYPTLEHFQQLVAAKQINYYIADSGRMSHANSQIQNWVKQNFSEKKVGDTVVYDLLSPKTTP